MSLSAPNPLARFAPCVISNQAHASKYAVPTLVERIDNDVWGFGAAYTAWVPSVPAGKPRTLTLNKATNPLWGADDGIVREPAKVYAALRRELAIVHAAGCDLMILDAEFERTAERDALMDDVVLAAIRDAMPGTPYCNFAAMPRTPHEGCLWPDGMLAQVVSYGNDFGVFPDPYTRLCQEIGQYATIIANAPTVPAIGYVGSSFVANAKFPPSRRSALYALHVAASGGVLLAFDQDDAATATDEGAECVALLDARIDAWLAVTGGLVVKGVTRVESDKFCCRVVVQLEDGSLAAVCVFRHPTTDTTPVADGLNGSLLMPPTHDETLTVYARKAA